MNAVMYQKSDVKKDKKHSKFRTKSSMTPSGNRTTDSGAKSAPTIMR